MHLSFFTNSRSPINHPQRNQLSLRGDYHHRVVFSPDNISGNISTSFDLPQDGTTHRKDLNKFMSYSSKNNNTEQTLKFKHHHNITERPNIDSSVSYIHEKLETLPDQSRSKRLTVRKRMLDPLATEADREKTTIRSISPSSNAKNLNGYLSFLSRATPQNLGDFRRRIENKSIEAETSLSEDRELSNSPTLRAPPLMYRLPTEIVGPSSTKMCNSINNDSINRSSKFGLSRQNSRAAKSGVTLSVKIANWEYNNSSNKKPNLKNIIDSSIKLKRRLGATFNIGTIEATNNNLNGNYVMALAEEAASNYLEYKSMPIKRKTLMEEMINYMKRQEVLDVFQGKVYRDMPLSLRLYSHMVQFKELTIEPTSSASGKNVMKKLKANNRLDRSSTIKDAKYEDLKTLRPKLVMANFTAITNVNKKLREFLLANRAQGLHTLESKLLQAHQDFTLRKDKTLRKIAVIKPRIYMTIKKQCEEIEDLIPIYQDLRDDDIKSEVDSGLTSKLDMNFSRDTRRVQGTLNKILKNLGDHIQRASPNFS